MIKEGEFKFVFNKNNPIPYKGKYPVKNSSFFTDVGADDTPYRPLRVELELTNQCNDSCEHCGMGAKKIGEALTHEQIDHVIEQVSLSKIPGIAITGGEPFLAQEQLKYLISTAQKNGVDIAKITSNAFWGKADCSKTIDPLIEAGILNNKHFVPTFMFSIGEQTTPLHKVASAFHYMVERFTEQQVSLALSSLKIPGEIEKTDELIRVYEAMYGSFPHDRIHLTERTYNNTDATVHFRSVRDWMNESYDCFTPTVGAYVIPTALLKVNGDFLSCACFNTPEQLRLGNIYEKDLASILKDANERKYIQTVRREGLKGFSSQLTEDVLNKQCGDYCASCAHILDALGEPKPGSSKLIQLQIRKKNTP